MSDPASESVAIINPLKWGYITVHGYQPYEDNAWSLFGIYSIREHTTYNGDGTGRWSVWRSERCISDKNGGIRETFSEKEAREFAERHYQSNAVEDLLPAISLESKDEACLQAIREFSVKMTLPELRQNVVSQFLKGQNMKALMALKCFECDAGKFTNSINCSGCGGSGVNPDAIDALVSGGV